MYCIHDATSLSSVAAIFSTSRTEGIVAHDREIRGVLKLYECRYMDRLDLGEIHNAQKAENCFTASR
jgi:hypothetical protein